MAKITNVLLAVVVAIVVLATQSLFIVSETNQAIVTQLGEYRYTASTPGIYPKMPFAQDVSYMDRRLLSSDAAAQEYIYNFSTRGISSSGSGQYALVAQLDDSTYHEVRVNLR